MSENTLSDKAANAWDKTKEVSSDAWEATKEGTKKAGEAIAEKSGDAWNKTKEVSSDAWEATKEGIRLMMRLIMFGRMMRQFNRNNVQIINLYYKPLM